MQRIVGWWSAHQVPLYLGAMALGSSIGLLAPGVGAASAVAIDPVIAALLFVTFLGIPLADLVRSLGDRRFVLTLLGVNFVAVPLLVFLLTRSLADDRGLLVGALLVLLTPCVDYVIVFTRIASGDASRLLAATPLLMLVQVALLPIFLALFAGTDVLAVIDLLPFVEAFLWLIAVPFAGAALVQVLARRHRFPKSIARIAETSMVPLMMLTLLLVIASQIAKLGAGLGELVRLVPIYLVFAVVMVGVGIVFGRVARLPADQTRAVAFSGSIRNSLVVLPLALALPQELGLAPLAVVTQTLVELVCLVCFVWLIPRALPDRHSEVQRTTPRRPK